MPPQRSHNISHLVSTSSHACTSPLFSVDFSRHLKLEKDKTLQPLMLPLPDGYLLSQFSGVFNGSPHQLPSTPVVFVCNWSQGRQLKRQACVSSAALPVMYVSLHSTVIIVIYILLISHHPHTEQRHHQS